MENRIDVVIVGTGVAGLFCALNLPRDKNIWMITKKAVGDSDSFLAQGGICVLKGPEDYDDFFEDTIKAGHYENNKEAVALMIKMSTEIIKDLINLGVEFEQKDGQFLYTKEGAHSAARILYHEDLTGKEITSKLLSQVQKRDNITIKEYTTMIDITHTENYSTGIVVSDKDGVVRQIDADYVILASGGLGGLFEHSTNFSHMTGDAISIAIKHRIDVGNVDYIQIHPTTLYSKKAGRRFLISESVRGEGAVLYNGKMERFVDELLPRDILTNEIHKQMEKEGSEHVWLSMKDLGSKVIKQRFPNIYKHCLKEGYDVTKECIPVTPGQHYLMGGIQVDLDSKTSMNHLYAIGETSFNGVHGANRLASNSLLESLVFAKRAAKHIKNNYELLTVKRQEVDLEGYSNLDELETEYKELLIKEIERNRNYEQSCNK